MDTGLGSMAEISRKKAEELKAKGLPVFEVGEILEIKGSTFSVENISSSHVSLKILKP